MKQLGVKNFLATFILLMGAVMNSIASNGENLPDYKNEDFYINGEFNVEKAKDAIVELCEYHGYPVFPGFRDKLIVTDYGEGHFTEMGLAANIIINNQEDKYMLLEIFLLPNQMLPEHKHREGDDLPAKLEAWLVRHGKSYVVGIGEDNMTEYPEVQVPECHNGGQVKTKHILPTLPGQVRKLEKVKTFHWQFAGPEGAIISEVANVHSSPLVRHSDIEANRYFLGK